MKTVFYRVDDKFIHAQFIYGWLPFLNAKIVMGVSEKTANDPESSHAYIEALPAEISASIIRPKEAVKSNIGEYEAERMVVLFSSLQDVLLYFEAGGKIRRLNLGGIYPLPDRKEYLPFIHLTDEEKILVIEMISTGTDIYCQDTPYSEPRELLSILQPKQNLKSGKNE